MADKDGPTDVDTTMSAKELLAGPQQWPETDCRRGLFQFLEGGVWALIVTFFTFWALFAPDLIQVLLPKEADKPCAVVTLLGFIVFFFEIILNFVLKRDYGGKPGLSKLTWFLLIDIVGTASLIPDFLPLFDDRGSCVGPWYSWFAEQRRLSDQYALLETKAAQPSDNDSMDVMDGIDVEEKDVPFLAGLADFVNGMMRM